MLPGCATASFSCAISASVSPSTSVCSSDTFVRSTTRERRTFVASCRPPRPASTTAASTAASAKAASAAAVIVSNCVAPVRSASARTRASATSRSTSSPAMVIRSDHERTWGETVAPTWSPSASSSASIVPNRSRLAVRAHDVHRLVRELRVAEGAEQGAHPVGAEAVGRPRRERREPADVRPVSRRALRARGDTGRASRAPPRRPRAGAFATNRSLASMPSERAISLPQPLELRRDVGGDLLAPGTDDRTEDSLLVLRLELDLDAAATIDPGRLLHAVERGCVRSEAVVGLGPRRHDEASAAIGEVRPDLLGHVRQHRMQERQQPLERGESGCLRILVGVVEARLDRLCVPVAEVVEGEVVRRVRRFREVVARDRVLERCASRIEAGEDPSLLDRARLEGRRHVLAGREDEARHVPELVRELAALLHGTVGEAHVLRRGHLQQPVAGRVRTVLVDHVAWVDARAEALRHAPAVAGQDGGVDDHVLERHLTEQLEPGEDHAVLPQPDDVPCRGLEIPRVEAPERGGVIRPAEGGEGPERRREPRVEHVLAAGELGSSRIRRTRRARSPPR